LLEKLSKYPNIVIFVRKMTKIAEIYTIFARKMPEFYIITARKIFLPEFGGGGTCPPCFPVSYAYGNL